MNRDFKGIWIPKEVWLSTNLTLQEKVLWVEINSLDRDGEGCFAGNKYFAEFFNLSTVWISNLISALQEKGYVKVEISKQEGNKRRIYTKGYMPPLYKLLNSTLIPTHINTLNNTRNKEKKATTKKASFKRTKDSNGKRMHNSPTNYGRITMSQFEDFWRLYPRKIDKGKAKANWTKICSKQVIYRPKWRDIKQAIMDQKQTPRWTKDGDKFIPYPATWLNNEHWLNDPAFMVETSSNGHASKGSFRTGTKQKYEVDDGTVQSICIADEEGNPNAITINRSQVAKEEWAKYWEMAHLDN